MARKVQPPGTTLREAKPPQEAGGADGKQYAREKKQSLPDRAEVNRLIAEMHAGLTGDAREKAQGLGHALSMRA